MPARLFLLALLLQQSSTAFTGTWSGKVNDRPAILLTVTNSSGIVAGQVRFFLQTEQPGVDRHSVLPLLDAIIAGDKLSFKLAQPSTQPGESKPPVMFEFVQ